MRKNCEVGNAENVLASSRNSEVKGIPLKARLSPEHGDKGCGLELVLSLAPGASINGRCVYSKAVEVAAAGVRGRKRALCVCVCVCVLWRETLTPPNS